MPKALTTNTQNGLEILSAFVVSQQIVNAADTEQATALGSFSVAVNTTGRLEFYGAVPFGGTGQLWIYDATPGAIASREVVGSRIQITNTSEHRKRSSVIKLLAGKIYQLRAACVDATPAGKTLLISNASMVDA